MCCASGPIREGTGTTSQLTMASARITVGSANHNLRRVLDRGRVLYNMVMRVLT